MVGDDGSGEKMSLAFGFAYALCIERYEHSRYEPRKRM